MLGVVARKLGNGLTAVSCPRCLRAPGAAAAALAAAAVRHDAGRRREGEGEGRSEEQVVVTLKVLWNDSVMQVQSTSDMVKHASRVITSMFENARYSETYGGRHSTEMHVWWK
jgi:hypothetical protein